MADTVYHVPLDDQDDELPTTKRRVVKSQHTGPRTDNTHADCARHSDLIKTARVLTVATVTAVVVALVALGLVLALKDLESKAEGGGASKAGPTTPTVVTDSSVGRDMAQPPLILFHAMNTDVEYVLEWTVIRFVDVLSNFGEGYDNATGIFTAPQTGTYLLSTTVCAQVGSWVYVNIVASGIAVVTTGTRDINSSGTCISATAVVLMYAGDQAGVEGAYNESEALYTDSAYSIPVFTGVLLRLGDVKLIVT